MIAETCVLPVHWIEHWTICNYPVNSRACHYYLAVFHQLIQLCLVLKLSKITGP